MPGIGAKSEAKLWSNGIHTWQQVMDADELPVSLNMAEKIHFHARSSLEALAARNHRYFSEALPAAESWRLFSHFGDNVAYIDIETTGLSPDSDQITTIALYDGNAIKYYVHGQNLRDFCDDILDYDLIVTYNGKPFDVPFIRSYLGIPMQHAHVDLRYILASLGYSGGLKRCEKRFGLDREDLAEVDGYFAVVLWYEYINNDNQLALDTLLAYNILDVVNLAVLMAHAYNQKTARTPFGEQMQVPIPRVPDVSQLPMQPDMETVHRLKRKHSWF